MGQFLYFELFLLHAVCAFTWVEGLAKIVFYHWVCCCCCMLKKDLKLSFFCLKNMLLSVGMKWVRIERNEYLGFIYVGLNYVSEIQCIHYFITCTKRICGLVLYLLQVTVFGYVWPFMCISLSWIHYKYETLCGKCWYSANRIYLVFVSSYVAQILQNYIRGMSDPPKSSAFWRILHGCGNNFAGSKHRKRAQKLVEQYFN